MAHFRDKETTKLFQVLFSVAEKTGNIRIIQLRVKGNSRLSCVRLSGS